MLLRMDTTGMFLYNDKFFQQIDGEAIGSPLGPTLPNFFSAKMEKKIMSIGSPNLPLLYLYVVLMTFLLYLEPMNLV